MPWTAIVLTVAAQLGAAEHAPTRLRALPPFSQAEARQSIAPSVAWPTWASGRLVTRPWLHLGVRPHVYTDGDERAAAVTVQLTVVAP